MYFSLGKYSHAKTQESFHQRFLVCFHKNEGASPLSYNKCISTDHIYELIPIEIDEIKLNDKDDLMWHRVESYDQHTNIAFLFLFLFFFHSIFLLEF